MDDLKPEFLHELSDLYVQSAELGRETKMKYKPERDLPEFVREAKTVSPSKLAEIVLNRRNREITAESVTMWFKRHPEVLDQLSKEIVEGLPTEKQAVDVGLFENGAFREIPSVKSWIRDLTNNNAKETTIDQFVRTLKRVCKGEVRKGEVIENWAWKHPDRLGLEDAKEFIFQVKNRKLRSREWRLVLRNFLISKGKIIKSSDISGKLEEDAGKYNTLKIAPDKREEVFAFLNTRNHEAYLISKFGYVTATRLTAALDADSQYIDHDDRAIWVFEKASKGKPKKKVKKYLTNELYDALKDRKGKIFSINETELNKLLREAYAQIIPEMNEIIPMPFHFWRHCFAQDMLRASGWNYALVASMGNWSVDALTKYYGSPNEKDVRMFVKETLPKLEIQINTAELQEAKP
jgi:integrase